MIRESSNLDETSSDRELSDWQNDDLIYAQRMLRSQSEVDERFIKLYKVKKATEQNIHIGFEESAQHSPKNLKRFFTAGFQRDVLVSAKPNRVSIAPRPSQVVDLANLENDLRLVEREDNIRQSFN